MANEPIFIKKQPFKYPSLDFNFLRDLGIRAAQRLSGQIWTDYNHHDPGVTILEQLCYAITDLGFRTDFPIQDLLHARSRQSRKETNSTLFDASEILPTNPTSLEDYRKLLIDRLPYVRNAWVDAIRDNLQGIQGLYRVQLQVDESVRKPELFKKIKSEVHELFSQYRNLSEDLDVIEILDVERIVVYADIEIGTEAIAEEVLAAIQFRVDEYLNPTIKFNSLEEMQAEGYTIDEIFDGPTPVHGFIKSEDLIPQRQEVYVSKIIEIITAIEGVRRITYFYVEKNDIPIEGDVIQIEQGHYPILDMDTLNERFTASNYPIQFYRGSLNYELDLNTANQLLHSQFARYKKGYELQVIYDERKHPSMFKQEDIAKYYSIQNSFPITYGLSRFGLPNNERPTRARLAMVKQLRGYLMMFEQILANYLAQLANVRQLFAIDMNIDRTYYSQVPTDITQIEELLNVSIKKEGLSGDTYIQNTVEEFRKKLEAITQKFDPFIDRRNRFLDHLLARFGEQFSTDFLLKMSHSYSRSSTAQSPEHDLINAKIKYLQNYIDVSRNRGRAYNYLDADETSWNVSGLEKRACLLLDIVTSSNESLLRIFNNKMTGVDALKFDEVIDFIDPKDFPEGFLRMDSDAAKEIAEIQFDKPADEPTHGVSKDEATHQDILRKVEEDLLGGDHDRNIFEKPTDEFLMDSELPQDGKDDTNLVAPSELGDEQKYQQKFIFRAASRSQLLIDLLTNGILSYNYVILPDERTKRIAIYYKGNKEVGIYKIRVADTRLQARQLVNELISYFDKINKYSEGMHLVEHLLLRPQAKDQHYFELLNDQDKPLLRSHEVGDQQEQRYISEGVPAAAAKRDNYEIVQINLPEPPPAKTDADDTPTNEDTGRALTLSDLIEDEKATQEPQAAETPATPELPADVEPEYEIWLRDQYGKYIARHPFTFTNKEDAEEKIQDIIDYVDSFKGSNVSIFSKMIYGENKRLAASTGDDFYSHEVSVVMPNWTTRFQNPDFRLLVKNTIMVNCPAHLHVHFYWIGVEEMADFEAVYEDWIYERLVPVPRQPQLDQKALAVTELLISYQQIVEQKRKKR